MANKKFPCPSCKGKGGEVDPILDDGSGPYYPCDLCDDSGFIEVDSEMHWCLRRDKIIKYIFDIRENLEDKDAEIVVKKVEEIMEILKDCDRTIKGIEAKTTGFDDIPF